MRPIEDDDVAGREYSTAKEQEKSEDADDHDFVRNGFKDDAEVLVVCSVPAQMEQVL